MCMVYYLGVDKKIPLVPWDDNDPAFNVAELSENELKVKRHFSKPFVYYFGSDTFCGCNFRCDECWEQYEYQITLCSKEDLELYQKNHNALNLYLKQNCSDMESVEIYGCWSDDEACDPKKIIDINFDWLTSERFYFEGRALYKVKTKSPGG